MKNALANYTALLKHTKKFYKFGRFVLFNISRPGANVTKRLTSVIYEFVNKLECLSQARFFSLV